MRNHTNLFLLSTMIVLAFSVTNTVRGSEQFSTFEEQKKPSATQLQKGTVDRLEAVLGTGYKTTTINSLPDDILNGVFLNLGIQDLKSTAQVSKCFNTAACKVLESAIRVTMLDEYINSCKTLAAPSLTYSQLYYAFVNVFPLYDKRKKYNTEKDINDEYADNALNSWWYPQYKNKEENQAFYSCQNIHSLVPELNTPSEAKFLHSALKASFQAFKEDVMESMKLYEKLYGRTHSRKEEVAKISWPERPWG